MQLGPRSSRSAATSAASRTRLLAGEAAIPAAWSPRPNIKSSAESGPTARIPQRAPAKAGVLALIPQGLSMRQARSDKPFFVARRCKAMREWVLAEQNHHFTRSQQWEVAVLPFGATEPHNLHMPYGTDNYQVDLIGHLACEKAYRAGA